MPDNKQPPDDARYQKHWRVTLAVMFIAQFFAGMGFSFVLPFFPFFFRALGVGSEKGVLMWMGWTSVAFGITMTFSAQFWGLLADRYGRKLMVLRSMLAGSIILGLMGFATSPWHLLALRVFQGASTGTVTASITLVSSVTPSANLGFSLGLMHTAILLGQASGQLAGGLLAEHFGFRVPCGIASFILFIGTLLVFFGAKEMFVPPRNKNEGGVRALKSIVNTKGFKAILSVYFLIYVLSTMIIPILPLYIEKLAGKEAGAVSLTGIILAVTVTLTGISAIISGKLGDRYGQTRILIFSLVMTGIVSIPQTFASSIWVLFVERCLFGLAVGGIIPSINALVSNTISREKIGSAYGLTSSVTCLGIGIGPLIGGTMASIFGLRMPFAVMGVAALLIAGIVHRMFVVRPEI